jgi:peptidyl-prolyl cis-trans isomerase C
MMVKAFEDAAFTQELNAIGPLIETNFGYHIIKTTAKTPAGTVSLEEATPRLKEMLDRRGKGELVRAYIDELRGKAKIEYPGRPKAEEPKKEE